jgi:hypothetical protein
MFIDNNKTRHIMQNWFYHLYNNHYCMALLIFALVGLVSLSYASSVFAPTGSNWQKMQTNSISSANHTTSSGLTVNDTIPLPAISSQLYCRQADTGC